MGFHPSGRPTTIGLRLASLVLLPAVGVLFSTGAAAGASQARHHHHHHRAHRHLLCLLPGGQGAESGSRCVRHHAANWTYWCSHSVRCAARHPFLESHFGLRGIDGEKIKSLPEGKWLRRFVLVGIRYHISPRILMAIGLIESYGGTTSTAYMGCLYPATYKSWPKQIKCAAQVLDRYGLSGYDPSNSAYPATIREHAHQIVIRAR